MHWMAHVCGGFKKAIHCCGKIDINQSVFYTKKHNISLQLKKHYRVLRDDTKGIYPLVGFKYSCHNALICFALLLHSW